MPSVAIQRPSGAVLTLDGVARYSVSRTAVATRHPVERGSDVSDHVQVQPIGISVSGIVTETPYASVSTSSGRSRTDAAIAFLSAAMEGGERLTVITDALGTHTEMVLVRAPVTRTVLRDVRVELELEQVRLAQAGTVTIAAEAPRRATTAAAGLPDAQDAGEQAPTDTETPEQDARDQSWALSIAQSLGLAG